MYDFFYFVLQAGQIGVDFKPCVEVIGGWEGEKESILGPIYGPEMEERSSSLKELRDARLNTIPHAAPSTPPKQRWGFLVWAVRGASCRKVPQWLTEWS